MVHPWRRFVGAAGRPGIALFGALALLAGPTRAATPLDSVSASPDITLELASTTFEDADIAVDNLLGVVAPAGLGNLPAQADLSAYHLLESGDSLFSLDTAAELPGSLDVEPRDLVRYDGTTYTLELDGSAAGVPQGAAIDAAAFAGGDLLLSFDTTVELPAAGSTTISADDEDLVRFDGSDWSFFFDGSAEGVAGALDLDGAHVLASGHLLVSFDVSGEVGGVSFDDEDALEYDPLGATWSLAFDGSAAHPDDWPQADLDALQVVPEPAELLLLVSGIAALALLGRGRMRR